MKKILYVASVYRHIQDFHLPYLKAFSELGYVTDLACRMSGGGKPDMVRSLIDLPFEKKIVSSANFRASRMLRRRILDETYDLIIVHTSLAAFFTRLAVKGLKEDARPKIINTVHGYLFDDRTPFIRRWLFECAELLTRRETDLLLTMNQWDRDLAVRLHLGRRVAGIPGMGLPAWESERRPEAGENRDARTTGSMDGSSRTDFDGQSLRSRYGIPEDAFVLLFCAEFSKRKSQDVLIRGMRYLPEHVYLALPGDGKQMENCRASAEAIAPGRVLFPGYVRDVRPWYEMADAVVPSSRYEGLPFNVLEAMHFGVPVAATEIKGHVDLLAGDPPAGLLWKYGEPEEFAHCVTRLMASPDLGAALCHEARGRLPAYTLESAGPQVMKQFMTFFAKAD